MLRSDASITRSRSSDGSGRPGRPDWPEVESMSNQDTTATLEYHETTRDGG